MKKNSKFFLRTSAFCKNICSKIWMFIEFVSRETFFTTAYLYGRLKRFFFLMLKALKFGKDKTLHATHTITDVVLSKEERRKFLQSKLKQNKLKLLFELAVFASVTFLIGLYFFIAQTDPNAFKKSIENSARKELGIDLHINGNIKWSIFKMYPAIEITDVFIDDVPFDNEFYNIKLGSVKTRVSLSSIIKKTNVISKIHLENIALSLSQKSGKSVGEDTSANGIAEASVDIKKVPRGENASGAQKNGDKNFAEIKFDIKEILIRDTAIKFKIGTFEDEFGIRNLTVQHILNDTKISLSSRFFYKNRNIYLSVVTSPLKSFFDGDAEIPLTIRAFSLNTSAEANLVLKNIFKSPTYIGTVNLSSENLQNILNLTVGESLYVGKINLKSEVIGNRNFMALRNIDLKVANSDVSGDVEFAFRNRLKINANFKSDLLDLPNIFWPNWRTDLPESDDDDEWVGPWVAENRLPNAFKDTPLMLDLAEKFDFNLDFKIKKVKAMPQMSVENVDIGILMNNGAMVIKNVSFDYAGGSLELTGIGMINEEKKLDASVGLTMENIDIGRVVEYTGYEDFIKGGNGQGRIYLSSTGRDLAELMDSVNGEFKLYSIGRIRVKEMAGAMTGSDIVFSLIDIFKGVVKKTVGNKKNIKADDAFVECFVANGVINDGRYESGLGLAVETNNLNIVVDGMADLGAETIDMKMITFPKSGVQILNSAADMVHVSGNMSEPDVNLSINGTAGSLVKTGVLSAGVALTGVGVAAIGIGFVAKTVWDNISNEKNPCNRALMLPINQNLSQNVFNNEYVARKLFAENFALFDGTLSREKKIFQKTLQ